MENQASREIINYEYYLVETHRYLPEPVSEFWELVDVMPKREGDRYFYILVFRKQVEELNKKGK